MAETRNTPSQQSQQPQQQSAPQQEPPETKSRKIEPYRSQGELARTQSYASPFSFMQRFMSDMDRLFSGFGFGPSMLSREASTWAPQIDVFERGDQLVVHADLPGLREEDVKVNLDEGMLTISGERTNTHENDEGGVYQRERSYGSFYRSIALPEGVDPESVRASFDNGVLEVTMPTPKPQPSKGRSIPIGPKRSSTGLKH
jgi:HSP20 family protein